MPTPRNYTKSKNRTTTYRRPTGTPTKPKNWSTYHLNAPGFKQPRNECEWRIGSYRTVYSQFTGTGKLTALSPTTANKWIKFVNSGYRIYKFSNTDFCNFFGTKWNTGTPTACHRWMKQKYGSGIKAVTRGKTNTWLIAATPNVNALPFRNYTWK